ncbi:MAG: hypothetical protein ABIQ39_15640 [Ilumatobacteraceae bacterium]
MTHPVFYVTDPEADASWAQATFQHADEIVIEDSMIVAVQREHYPNFHSDGPPTWDGPVKVEWRWVLGVYDAYATRVGETVSGHKIEPIQGVMDRV